MRFKGGGDGEADGLLRPALVRHHEVGRERVEAALDAFHRGEERLQVDGYVCAFFTLHVWRSCDRIGLIGWEIYEKQGIL